VETVTILRTLWCHRVAVCLVAVVAIVIGWMAAYHPSFPPERRAYSVGMASTGILIDTPKSQVVEVDPEGAETLAARANVLSNLMVDGEIKSVIARRAGLRPEQIIATTATAAAANPPPLHAGSHVLTTSLAITSDMSEIPIIRVEAQAPDVRQAIALANASVAAVSEYVDSKAVAETISDARRLRVRPLGTAQGHTAMRGPSRVLALAAALLVLVVGCGLILVTSALVRTWRTAAAFDRSFGGADATAGAGFAFEPPRTSAVDSASEPSGHSVEHVNGSGNGTGATKQTDPREREAKQAVRSSKRAARAAEAAAAASRTSGR
jgi:hypothetical protein